MQQFAEVLARFGLQARGGFAVLRFQFAQSRGQRNVLRASGCGQRTFGQDIFHAIGVEPPFCDQAIRGQPRVQRAFGDAVAIRNVAAGDGAQAHKIEMRVFQFQADRTSIRPSECCASARLAAGKISAACRRRNFDIPAARRSCANGGKAFRRASRRVRESSQSFCRHRMHRKFGRLCDGRLRKWLKAQRCVRPRFVFPASRRFRIRRGIRSGEFRFRALRLTAFRQMRSFGVRALERLLQL